MLSRLAHADPNMKELKMRAKRTGRGKSHFKNWLIGFAAADRNKE
jgi:hypothetical protein